MHELPFRIAVWTIYTRSIFWLVLLRIFWNFGNTSSKESMVRSSRSLVFNKISILKKFAKLTRKHQCWSHFLIVSRNKETPAQVFSCELWKAFKNTFFTKHPWWSWSLSQKKFYIVGVHRKVFDWLAANELLSRSKNYLHTSCVSISNFSIFCITCFFYLNTPAWRKVHSIKLWGSSHQKVFISVNLLEKCLSINAGLWSSVCVWFWTFEKLLEDFRDVCKQGSVLIIGGSTEYEFSAAIFIKLSKLSAYYVLSWDACVQRQTREWRKREKLFLKTSTRIDSCWLVSDLCWFVLTRVGFVLIRVDSYWTRVDLCQTRADSCWFMLLVLALVY